VGFFHVINKDKLAIKWSKDVIVHDVRKRLPFPDDYFNAIYASHFLEHLYLKEAKEFLNECYRILAPGGIIRLVVPDLHSIVMEYLEEKASDTSSKNCEETSAADRLCSRLAMRPVAPFKDNILYRFYTAFKDFHSHKWSYDSESLIMHLHAAGFSQIFQKQFLDSLIPDIKEVERENRIMNGAGICVEGTKPHTNS
jgi:ubiquinone/menaquinone biosynthesis C-methylase UbiE